MIIDYDQFCSKRFDIVLRFHLLLESEFNVANADILFESDKYKFLKFAIKKVNPRLIRKGVFDYKKWVYVENAVAKRRYWLAANPYLVNSNTNYGSSVKRFLLSIKYQKNMFWIEDNNMKERSGFNKEDYIKVFPKNFVETIAYAEKEMIEAMKRLSFFDINNQTTKINVFFNKTKDLLFH